MGEVASLPQATTPANGPDQRLDNLPPVSARQESREFFVPPLPASGGRGGAQRVAGISSPLPVGGTVGRDNPWTAPQPHLQPPRRRPQSAGYPVQGEQVDHALQSMGVWSSPRQAAVNRGVGRGLRAESSPYLHGQASHSSPISPPHFPTSPLMSMQARVRELNEQHASGKISD